MNIKKLWTKLFANNNEEDEVALHVAGATVRHKNPFENIEVPRNEEEVTKEFADKWVGPFYMHIFSNLDDIAIQTFAEGAKKIDKNIVLKLLSNFNWRTRITGAYFSAINHYTEFEDIIGSHLLKSEVCYAGYGYCLALATFGTDNAKNYLITYLDYYLDRKDLWFDQSGAFCALQHLDNSSADKLMEKWNSFVEDKPYSNLEESRESFSKSLLNIEKIRNATN